MGENHADIDRHVRVYMAVFGTLLVFTGLTVAAWKWGPEAVGPTVAIALAIATIKASLVALFFMHLNAEKKLVYWVLALAVVFFFALLLTPVLSSFDAISN
jgi:cytochrome c oxidase subunit 4